MKTIIMQTLTTLYRKHEKGILFWSVYFQNDNSISFTWGIVGSSQGSRIKSFDTYEATLSFYRDFTTRLKQSFSYEPTICRYKLNLRIALSLPLHYTTEQFVGFSNPIYTAVETELKSTGNGLVGSLKIDEHILTIPLMVIDSSLAFNKIRELLAGFGISRNRLLFLPH
jgi:predicted DNA-binding WGR domain protein